jgi:hypothetical protein
MKLYPIPEKCLDNFERASAIDGNLYRETFGEDNLRFASDGENYMVKGIS